MKINKSTLTQTSFTCPSSWTGCLDNGDKIEIYFRLGKLQLKAENKVIFEGERNQFDVSSFMDLEEALKIIEKGGIESE